MADLIYPTNLYAVVCEKWKRPVHHKEQIPPLPKESTFQKLVDTVYHASFLTEERRRIWFRVIYVGKKDMIKEGQIPYMSMRVVEFTKPRIFSVSELVKLAPAADPTQVLICVYDADRGGELEVWGLIEAGTTWWEFERHERSGGRPPPDAFTLSSKSPGQIAISRSGFVLLMLNQGKIITPSSDVFYQGPIAAFLKKGQQHLYTEVCKRLKIDKWDPEGHDDDYPSRFYIFFLERVLNRIREKFHGGTLVVIPDELKANDTRLQDRIVIKYPCHYDASDPLVEELEHHHRYFDLHFKLWEKAQITKEEYRGCIVEDSDLKEAKEKVKHAASFLSSLSAVDGAVVITDRLRLLGFGAEIIAISPSLKNVRVITDYRKNESEYRDIELFGTRHRSAFRFCSSFEDSIVAVVSQDGEIRVAKRVGSDVILWPSVSVALLGF
jgi:hypothetical protein